MTETLADGYSCESTRRELSNEHQHDRVQMIFQNLFVLVLWTKVASALEGLSDDLSNKCIFGQVMVDILVQVFAFASFHIGQISPSSIRVNPSNAKAIFIHSTRTQRFFENCLNPIMLVFIG